MLSLHLASLYKLSLYSLFQFSSPRKGINDWKKECSSWTWFQQKTKGPLTELTPQQSTMRSLCDSGQQLHWCQFHGAHVFNGVKIHSKLPIFRCNQSTLILIGSIKLCAFMTSYILKINHLNILHCSYMLMECYHTIIP